MPHAAQPKEAPHLDSPMTITTSNRELTEQLATHDVQEASPVDMRERTVGLGERTECHLQASRYAASDEATRKSLMITPTSSTRCAVLERGTVGMPPPLELPKACI